MAGPLAIAAMGMKAVAQGVTTQIGTLCEHDLNRITPDVIARAAESGDAVARDILRRAGFYLGTGIANLITLLAPDCVVVGGGVTNLGRWIFDPIHDTVRQRVFTVPLDRVAIVPAQLGGDAGVYGAAIWAGQRAGR
jgi:glucokinase